MLHMLFRMLQVSLPVCLLPHMLFRMLPVSPPVCLLLRTLFHMLNQSLFLPFSIRKDLIMRELALYQVRQDRYHIVKDIDVI